MKVLVVDDDKLARKGLISIMDWGKYGFEVVGNSNTGYKDWLSIFIRFITQTVTCPRIYPDNAPTLS